LNDGGFDLLNVEVCLDRAGRAEDTRLGLTQASEEGRAGGATYTAIAQELGVGKTTVRRALTSEML